jgi:ATP-dependent DNA helicase DinG
MSTETHTIKGILGENGLVTRSLKDFEYRSSQMEMAYLIENSIEKKVPLIIEAGTGIGKTLGYLVPLVLSGKKAVISTGTKNLQEQIFFKDIPMLSAAIGRKIDALLMKGRKNYLCLNKYDRFLYQATLFERMTVFYIRQHLLNGKEIRLLKGLNPGLIKQNLQIVPSFPG